MQLLTLSVSIFLVFQRAFHRASNTMDKCLWKRHQCPLPKGTDVIFFHGPFAKATEISFLQLGKIPLPFPVVFYFYFCHLYISEVKKKQTALKLDSPSKFWGFRITIDFLLDCHCHASDQSKNSKSIISVSPGAHLGTRLGHSGLKSQSANSSRGMRFEECRPSWIKANFDPWSKVSFPFNTKEREKDLC